jgi:hypothetical protein
VVRAYRFQADNGNGNDDDDDDDDDDIKNSP